MLDTLNRTNWNRKEASKLVEYQLQVSALPDECCIWLPNHKGTVAWREVPVRRGLGAFFNNQILTRSDDPERGSVPTA